MQHHWNVHKYFSNPLLQFGKYLFVIFSSKNLFIVLIFVSNILPLNYLQWYFSTYIQFLITLGVIALATYWYFCLPIYYGRIFLYHGYSNEHFIVNFKESTAYSMAFRVFILTKQPCDATRWTSVTYCIMSGIFQIEWGKSGVTIINCGNKFTCNYSLWVANTHKIFLLSNIPKLYSLYFQTYSK